MKPETEQRWRVHVTAWAKSGLTCRAYAAKAGVNGRTLTWWKSKLREAVTPASFVAGDLGDVRADVLGPADHPRRRPVSVRLVRLGAVRGICDHRAVGEHVVAVLGPHELQRHARLTHLLPHPHEIDQCALGRLAAAHGQEQLTLDLAVIKLARPLPGHASLVGATQVIVDRPDTQGGELRFLPAAPPTPERMTAVLAQVHEVIRDDDDDLDIDPALAACVQLSLGPHIAPGYQPAAPPPMTLSAFGMDLHAATTADGPGPQTASSSDSAATSCAPEATCSPPCDPPLSSLRRWTFVWSFRQV